MARAWWWLVDWVQYLLGRETRDDAWIAGSRDADEGWQAFCDQKDTFIAEQSELITELDNWIWNVGLGQALPEHLERKLRDYR